MLVSQIRSQISVILKRFDCFMGTKTPYLSIKCYRAQRPRRTAAEFSFLQHLRRCESFQASFSLSLREGLCHGKIQITLSLTEKISSFQIPDDVKCFTAAH